MLVQVGAARSNYADRQLAWSLAGIAGTLNAAGFYAVGFYSSNMAGNVSALAENFAFSDLHAAVGLAAIVATFILGAAASAILISAGQRRGIAGIYVLSILAEVVLLIGLACVDLWLDDTERTPLLAFGLTFLLGLQNAVVTRISDARVRTTHVTGMITDIGIELGKLADLGWRGRLGSEASRSRDRLWLHGVTVLSFLGCGVAGVFAYRAVGAWLLFGVATLLLALVIRGLRTRCRDMAAGVTAKRPEAGRGR